MNIKLVVTTIVLCVVGAMSAADQSVDRPRSATHPPVAPADTPTTPVAPPPTRRLMRRSGAVAGADVIRNAFQNENQN